MMVMVFESDSGENCDCFRGNGETVQQSGDFFVMS